MAWVKMEIADPPEGSLWYKLATVIPRDFPDGFDIGDLMAHPAFDDEEREELRWHGANGARVYGFGHLYIQRRQGRWEVVDYRSQRALWFGALLCELGMSKDDPVRPGDPVFLHALDRADRRVRDEMGPPDFPPEDGRRKTDPDTPPVFERAGHELKQQFGDLHPLSLDFARDAVRMIDYARSAEEAGHDFEENPGPHLPMCRAAFLGDAEQIRELIAAGAPVDDRDEDDRRALDYAALRGFLDVARVLLDAGADVHAGDTEGYTALHAAVESDNLALVHLMVDRGADINSLTKGDTSVLHIAACAAGPEVIDFLIERGAKVNAYDGIATPLDEALHFANREVIPLLRRHGAKYAMDLTIEPPP